MSASGRARAGAMLSKANERCQPPTKADAGGRYTRTEIGLGPARSKSRALARRGDETKGEGKQERPLPAATGGEEASEGGQGLCTRGLRAARATGRDAGALEGLRRMCRSDGAGQAQGRRRPVGCRPAGAWASEAPAGGPVIPYRYGCLSSASLGWKPRLTPAAARREHQPWSVARRGRQQPGRHPAYTVPAY